MHGSKGNTIESNEAVERMGADVMRWMFCEHVPSQNLKFGYGPANEIKRRLLTLWNSVAFLVTYGNIEGFRPTYADLEGPEFETKPLDRWLLARTQQLLREAEAEYERFWTPGIVRAFDSFVDDLSNWYIRRSRRRFYAYDEAAFRTLWYAVVQASRVVAPVLPFLAEHLWQNLVADPCDDAPRSVFLAPWPEASRKCTGGFVVSGTDDASLTSSTGQEARTDVVDGQREQRTEACGSGAAARSRLCRRRRLDPGHRNRRKHRHLLCHRSTPVAPASVS
jgi:isoleucyl-tRNA synthetase